MKEKRKYIEEYLYALKDGLAEQGIRLTVDQIENIIGNFVNWNDSSEEIVLSINRVVAEEQKRKEILAKLASAPVEEVRQLQDLDVMYRGITLNNQDIDLMMIAGANSPQELQDGLMKITNIMLGLNTLEMSNEQFLALRERVYSMYLDSLSSRDDYLKNHSIELAKKIDYLRKFGQLTEDEVTRFNNILVSAKGDIGTIVRGLNESFTQEQVHVIFKTIRDYTPIEKEGIKESGSIETSRRLLTEIKNKYNSITIDEEAKYGKIVLADGTFDFEHLGKSLEFAKRLGKQVRLNTLIFYMDCPDVLYKLEKTPENKALVKEKLKSYVEATTRYVAENGFAETVRSIDIFNELLNRFPMDGDVSYQYRGDINQEDFIMSDGQVDDNVISGWLKHLDIEDLCEVASVARKNLPNTDFMYNDDHLTDPKKMEATIKLFERIRQYEERHGVRFIDSIGTQMHIDNDMTKDQMKEMLINLSQFGLPIEITEFDMAMTQDIEGLTNAQIEALRQQKINEVYECVEELKEQCNIRGFTIWSKTDKQNFRVYLKNEKRINNGQMPISTLYGGNYTDEMLPKNKVYEKADDRQNFNYHTHTNRCGHAGMAEDYEYVAFAKENGITQLGFSDHVPFTELEYQDDEQRMHISEVDDYILSIRKLQQDNPDMIITCGFEAEYDPMKEAFLGELREKVDYMILGQHFVSDGLHNVSQQNNPVYPKVYAKMLCKGMDSGIFDIVAHPDIFMAFRDTVVTEEGKKEFDKNAREACEMICAKAKEVGIPLEFNFGGIEKGQKLQDGNYAYPHPLFWNIAAESGVQVLYGVDAHTPSQFDRMAIDYGLADEIIDSSKLNLVAKDYNPVEARKHNETLQRLYEKGQESSLTYETHLVSKLVDSLLQNIPEETDAEMLYFAVSEGIKKGEENLHKEVVNKNNRIADKINSVSNNMMLTDRKKGFELRRAKENLEHTQSTLINRQSALKRAGISLGEAMAEGCQTKSEIVSKVTEITEMKTTRNEAKKQSISNNLSGAQKQTSSDMPKVHIKVNNTNNESSSNSNGNSGFTNFLLLAMSLILVGSVILGLIWWLCKMI